MEEHRKYTEIQKVENQFFNNPIKQSEFANSLNVDIKPKNSGEKILKSNLKSRNESKFLIRLDNSSDIKA